MCEPASTNTPGGGGDSFVRVLKREETRFSSSKKLFFSLIDSARISAIGGRIFDELQTNNAYARHRQKKYCLSD